MNTALGTVCYMMCHIFDTYDVSDFLLQANFSQRICLLFCYFNVSGKGWDRTRDNTMRLVHSWPKLS